MMKPFARRHIYGRSQWVQAPPPYASRYNMPQVLRRSPFDLLRSHNYPKHPQRYQRGVRQWQQGGQNPQAIFMPSPARIHPYSYAGSGPSAISQARRQMMQMAAQGTPAGPKQAMRSKTSQAAFTTFQMSRPYEKEPRRSGPGAKDIPFEPRSGLPPAALKIRAALNQQRAATGGVIPPAQRQTLNNARNQEARIQAGNRSPSPGLYPARYRKRGCF